MQGALVQEHLAVATGCRGVTEWGVYTDTGTLRHAAIHEDAVSGPVWFYVQSLRRSRVTKVATRLRPLPAFIGGGARLAVNFAPSRYRAERLDEETGRVGRSRSLRGGGEGVRVTRDQVGVDGLQSEPIAARGVCFVSAWMLPCNLDGLGTLCRRRLEPSGFVVRAFGALVHVYRLHLIYMRGMNINTTCGCVYMCTVAHRSDGARLDFVLSYCYI